MLTVHAHAFFTSGAAITATMEKRSQVS